MAVPKAHSNPECFKTYQNHGDHGCSPALYWKYGMYPAVLKSTLHLSTSQHVCGIFGRSLGRHSACKNLILFVWERRCIPVRTCLITHVILGYIIYIHILYRPTQILEGIMTPRFVASALVPPWNKTVNETPPMVWPIVSDIMYNSVTIKKKPPHKHLGKL